MLYVEALNQQLFLLLNVSEGSPDWLILVAKVAAELTIYLIPLLLISLWLWDSMTNRQRAIHE